MSRKKDIDLTDIQILNILQQDASMTNQDLAAKIGLAPANTLKRVRHLRQKQAIRSIQAHLSYAYFGFNFRAMVVVKLPRQYAEDFYALLRGNQYVLTAHAIQGDAEGISKMQTVIFEVLARNQQHFVTAISRQYAGLPYYDYIDFDVYPVMSVIKDTTSVELTVDDAG